MLYFHFRLKLISDRCSNSDEKSFTDTAKENLLSSFIITRPFCVLKIVHSGNQLSQDSQVLKKRPYIQSYMVVKKSETFMNTKYGYLLRFVEIFCTISAMQGINGH